jgi:N utilization substance protein B
MSRPTARRRSREAALQVLYALDLGDDEGAANAFERVAENFELPDGAREFAWTLVAGVMAGRGAIDARLAEHAKHWRIDRMSVVDRNILRLGAFELASGTPCEVVIDEAVRLARRFGGDRSPGFVNGVLDAVARGSAPGPDADVPRTAGGASQ